MTIKMWKCLVAMDHPTDANLMRLQIQGNEFRDWHYIDIERVHISALAQSMIVRSLEHEPDRLTRNVLYIE